MSKNTTKLISRPGGFYGHIKRICEALERMDERQQRVEDEEAEARESAERLKNAIENSPWVCPKCSSLNNSEDVKCSCGFVRTPRYKHYKL